MDDLIKGLHHITALAKDPQRNVDFYCGILGLRLIKKTINFDAPEVYHLYYGDESGSPGTILTFFPYPDIPRGRKGKGQLTVTAFSIPDQSFAYWMQRLKKFQIPFIGPEKRFDEVFIYFEDPDGLGLELVENSQDKRKGYTDGLIPEEKAIKGFYGITLAEECFEKTSDLLIGRMNHQLMAEKGSRFRFSASGKKSDYIDVLCTPDTLRGLSGSGTIHHVAFAVENDAEQVKMRKKLISTGLNVTPVIDREYFHSIYFREPGGVLFEVATAQPGFLIDETLDHLGESLKLPPWEEKNREAIEQHLTPIHWDGSFYADQL